jgi:monoamine oxidase
MGQVVKVTLQFHERIWPEENFGFVHSNDRWLPTWWAHERANILTGWAGGPRAQALSTEPREVIMQRAIAALARIFEISPAKVQHLVASTYFHDWNNDLFTRGAYAFTPVGMTDQPTNLAIPVADTLFFAGEATDFEGDQGTVHGALASGKRAAHEVLKANAWV